MKLRIGYELQYQFAQPTPAILMLNVHPSRVEDLLTPDDIKVFPDVPLRPYRDGFGNACVRLVAPAGLVTISSDALIKDEGLPDPVAPHAQEVPVDQLPEDVLIYLLPSRFCESDRLLNVAWSLFGGIPQGWTRAQAICEYVHNYITFGYQHANVLRTASTTFDERRGVCRDYAHLAIALCRAMNIPARYCTGHLGDARMPPPYEPGDFSAWMEVYLDGRWHMFDPRNNCPVKPRYGRVLMARGRDAADVAITTTFGVNTLLGFRVWCDEVESAIASNSDSPSAPAPMAISA